MSVHRSPRRGRRLTAVLSAIVVAITMLVPATALAHGTHAAHRHHRHHGVHQLPASVAAPQLTANGQTLQWKRVAGITGYVLQTTKGGSVSYRWVWSTSYTPAAAPGTSVTYRLRAGGGSYPYSSPVTITYPAATSTTKPTTGNPTTNNPTSPTTSQPTSTTTSSPTAPSTPVSGSRSAKLRVAVMNTTGWGLDSRFANAGIHWTRLDVGDGSDISLVQKAVNDGVKPLVLYNPGPSGGLGGVSPATAAAQVKSLAQRILPLGLTEIEFGNEVYYAENATTYAAQYAAAHTALAGMGIKLLAVGTAVASGQAGYSTPTWMADFVHALPGGASEVDAWTIHPYGYMNQITDSGSWGWPTLAAWHNIALGLGSTAPWYITEVGQCLSGCAITTDQAGQAAATTQYLNDIQTKYPWVSYIDFYTCRDDSSGQWGLLNTDNSPRPAMTALTNWMSANSANVNG